MGKGSVKKFEKSADIFCEQPQDFFWKLKFVCYPLSNWGPILFSGIAKINHLFEVGKNQINHTKGTIPYLTRLVELTTIQDNKMSLGQSLILEHLAVHPIKTRPVSLLWLLGSFPNIDNARTSFEIEAQFGTSAQSWVLSRFTN